MSEPQLSPAPAVPDSAVNVRLVLTAVICVMLLASLGQTIITTALPIIVGDLGGIEHISWAFTAYLLATTVAAPVFGKLGDMFGRKIVLQAGILIFLAGSVAAALSVDLNMLVVCRFIQGIGGGGLIVTSMAAVGDVLPPRQRGRAGAFVGMAFGISTVVGPLLGGVIVEILNWRWLFFVNIPVGIAAFAVITAVLESRTERKHRKIDYLGAALLATALSALVIYTSIGGTVLPWLSVPGLAILGLAIAAVIGFVFAELRAPEPILPMFLFRNNAFLVSNGVGFIVGTVMFGTITFLPSYLLIVKGYTPTQAGLGLIPLMFGLIGASTLSGSVMARTGRYKILPIVSTLILAVAAFLLAGIDETTPFALAAFYSLLVGIGIGPVMAVGVSAVQNAVPPSVLGVGTASVQMFRHIGGSFGVAILGAVFANRLAHEASAIGLADTSGFNAETLALLPPVEQFEMASAYAAALHPVFWVAGTAALIAFALSFLLREAPLPDTLAGRHPDPQAAE